MRYVVASLIVGAFHTAGQSRRVGKKAYHLEKQRDNIEIENPAGLLAATDGTGVRIATRVRGQ